MNQDQLAEKLKKHADSIQLIDCFSQQGFGRISALARVALLALESDLKVQQIEAFAGVFEEIQAIAEDMESCINVEAEEAGCNYVNPAHARRMEAFSRSLDKITGRGA